MGDLIYLAFYPLCKACQPIKTFHDNLNEAERESYGLRKDIMILTDWEHNRKVHFKHWPIKDQMG